MTSRTNKQIPRKVHLVYRSCSNWEAGGILFDEPWQSTESDVVAMRIAQKSTTTAQACLRKEIGTIKSEPSYIFSSGYSWVVMAFEFSMLDTESRSESIQRLMKEARENDYEGVLDRFARAITYYAGADIHPTGLRDDDKTCAEKRVALYEALDKFLESLG